MSDANEHIRPEEETQAERPRLPYEPPCIVREADFETLALTCVSLPNNGACFPNYSSS